MASEAATAESGARLRARSSGPPANQRARSRGATPSELLARKQQMLASSGNLDSLGDSFGSRQRGSRLQQAEYGAARARTEVEAKLDGLSELLLQQHHQQEPTGGQQDLSSAKSIEDVYILLAKKEQDLQLAAELGKALLEKNEELSKANELITEDYSHKLELLEQDKHKLKRQLAMLDGDYENRLIELQTDCNILKNQLDEQQQVAKQKEKEKCKLIDDLVQQNQRLTSELVEATKSEELLSSQLEQMNQRFNVRLSNRQDHVAQLDALKEEIQIVNQRKQDLERRLKLAQEDKSNLSAALDESGDKLLILENVLNDKETKLQELTDEVHELRDSSGWLSNELENMINLNEKLALEGGQVSNADEQFGELAERKRSQLVDKLKELRLRSRSRLKASQFIESTRRQSQPTSRRHRRPTLRAELGRPRSASSLNEELSEEEELERGESPNGDFLAEIYDLLRRFQASLQHRRDALASQSFSSPASTGDHQHLYSPNSADDSGISADDLDKSSDQVRSRDPEPWRRLLGSLKLLLEEMPCSTCQLMIGERADYEQLQKLHVKLGDEMRRKDDELLRLNVMKTEQETRLAALEERCQLLSDDLSNCDKPKEEIVKLAWRARDEAVERKNNAEISLAKTRIESMQIASQLMEAVQQKGELSQRLAQFEDDIHYITQDSVKAKFTWEEYAEKLRRSKTAQPDSANCSPSSQASSNPLAQLLSFSTVASTIIRQDTNGSANAGGGGGGKSSAMDNLTQPASLMRNFTSNRFNLRFWQRSSNEKSTATIQQPATIEKAVPLSNSNNNNNSSSSLAEQKAS